MANWIFAKSLGTMRVEGFAFARGTVGCWFAREARKRIRIRTPMVPALLHPRVVVRPRS